MHFSIHTGCLFPDVPFEQALALVRAHGFDTVEAWQLDRGGVPAMADALYSAGVRLSAFCPAFFTLNDPAQHDAYERSLLDALADAKALGCNQLITQVGNDTGAPRAQQHDAILAGLRRMAPHVEAAGVTLMIEPLNDVRDHIGYYMTDSNEALDLVRAVQSPYIRVIYDIYHQVHMGEDVMARIGENIDLIAHFHIAGHPDRDARLFTGGFDYTPVLRLIRDSGTDAPIGLELMPGTRGEAEALLDSLADFR